MHSLDTRRQSVASDVLTSPSLKTRAHNSALPNQQPTTTTSNNIGCQDITIEPDDTDLSELSDVSDSESDIHYRNSDSEIEGEEN